MAAFLRQPPPPGAVALACPPPEEGDPLFTYPALHEFLTLAVWDDGSPRQTGTLLLCWGEGRWRAWLNDRDSQRSAWLSAAALADLLGAIEDGLVGSSLEWRRAVSAGQGRQRK